MFFGITFTVLFYFSAMISEIAMCAPPNDATQLEYLAAISSERCMSRDNIFNVPLGTVNVISDLYILVLPLQAVWSLQLPTKKKFGVSAVLMTGVGDVS